MNRKFFGLDIPIIQAPMAGGITTPELVATVSNTGALGSLGAGYMEPAEIRIAIRKIKFYSLLTFLPLTREKVRIPLIAAGGIMDGCSASATFLVGASAAQLGTAFLTTTESGASSSYKQALLKTPHMATALTKVFTGKTARAIVNPFMQKLEGHEIPPYPIQHFITHRLRSLAAQKNRPDLMSLWAGQGYPLCRHISAAAPVHEIAKEIKR